MKHTSALKPHIDPQISKLLKESGFKVELEPRHDGEAHSSVKAHGPDGHVTFKESMGNVVAIVRPSGNRKRTPVRNANGNLVESHVVELNDRHLEFFPSDQQAGMTLTRNLKEDACLRFVKSRGCSMAAGNALLEVQSLWRQAMPAMGVLVLEFTGGTGDADNAKVRAIDAARRLTIYSARTTKKRWQYITDMALAGMHPAEIAQKHHITAGVVRRQLSAALDAVSRRG